MQTGCSCTPEDRLYGTWKAAFREIQQPDGGHWRPLDVEVTIVFDGHGKYEDRIDGVAFSYGTYTLDFSQNPAWIDIVPKKELSFGDMRSTPLTKGIIRFPNPDVIEIGFDGFPVIGDKRPASFNWPDTTFMISLTNLEAEKQK